MAAHISDTAAAASCSLPDQCGAQGQETYRRAANITDRKTSSTTVTGSTSGVRCNINGIESFWALVKRRYSGPFHHVESRHLLRHANELVERLSDKAAGTVENMGNSTEFDVQESTTSRR